MKRDKQASEGWKRWRWPDHCRWMLAAGRSLSGTPGVVDEDYLRRRSVFLAFFATHRFKWFTEEENEINTTLYMNNGNGGLRHPCVGDLGCCRLAEGRGIRNEPKIGQDTMLGENVRPCCS